MSVGYAELSICKVSIIYVVILFANIIKISICLYTQSIKMQHEFIFVK